MHDPWDVVAAFEELAEERLGGLLIPPTLHQDVEHGAVLIHRPPEIVSLLIDGEEDFIEVPRVAQLGATATQAIGIRLAKLATPFPGRLVGHDHAADEQEFLYNPVTEDHLGWLSI